MKQLPHVSFSGKRHRVSIQCGKCKRLCRETYGLITVRKKRCEICNDCSLIILRQNFIKAK